MNNDRKGFALPAVIGALLIIGILVTAGFYTARQELRVGVASAHTNLAVNIAQAGVNEVMANWNGYQLGNILPWTDTTLTDTIADGVWTVNITNSNDFVYFLTATGEVTRGGDMWAGASRSIGLAAKILFADIRPPAALTTRGQVKIGGTSDIDGSVHTPASWAPYCTTVPAVDTTGILVDDTTGGNPDIQGASATISGSPASAQDSTLVDSSFTTFGPMDWAELTAYAQLDGMDITDLGSTITTVGPQVTGGECDIGPHDNWGDTVPTNPCGGYFPLMYHGYTGNVRINSNGYGQGILLVEGNLELTGGFTFFGIIIVQGSFETGTGTNRVVGAVMASNSADLNQTVLGTALIEYSPCTIQRAILNNAALSRARPMEQRSWVDLTAVTN